MTPPPSIRAAFVAAVLATSAVGPAAQAQSDPSSLPTEFVTLLIRNVIDGSNMNSRPSFVIGVPPFLASQIGAPPGGRILGAVSWQTSVDVVGTAPGTIDTVRMWFANDFVKRGYTPVTNDYASQYGGFRDPLSSPVTGYCGNNAQYTISIRPRDASTAEFRIRVTPSFGVCVGRGGSAGTTAPTFRGAPLLYNPPLAERQNRCASMGMMSSTGTQTAFVTSQQPSDILSHYGRQLDSAGWKLVTPMPATGTWVKKDSAGRQLSTTISITASQSTPDCRSATMQFSEIHP